MKKTNICHRILAFGFLIFISVLGFHGMNYLFDITGIWKAFSFVGACCIPYFFNQTFIVLYKLEEETKDLPSPGGAEGWW